MQKRVDHSGNHHNSLLGNRNGLVISGPTALGGYRVVPSSNERTSPDIFSCYPYLQPQGGILRNELASAAQSNTTRPIDVTTLVVGL